MNEPTIKSSIDYDLFSNVFGNRVVKRRHVQDLAESIAKRNLLMYNPIIVTESLQVVDGQHRLEAARLQKVPIYYVTMKDATIDDVQLLNATMKAWTLLDFINAYAETGNDHYKKLLDFSQEYALSPTVSAGLLEGGAITGGGGPVLRRVKSGKFTVKDEKEARITADKLIRMTPFTDDQNIVKTREFVWVIKKVETIGSFDKLLKKLKEQKVMINRMARARDYARVFEEAYNKDEAHYTRFY